MLPCPACEKTAIDWRSTLKGILWAILCFPCGIYCCIRRKERFCNECHCEVVSREYANSSEKSFRSPYSQRSSYLEQPGLDPQVASQYRNAANSLSNSYHSTDNPSDQPLPV